MTIAKKIKLAIPFLILPVITPFYLILDHNVLINIFGCGCVPSLATNMLNIPFNTNDLRKLVYTILIISIFVLALFLSKQITNKANKLKYLIAVLAVNIVVGLYACTMFVWK